MARFFRPSLAGIALALSGCVVAPPPTPVIPAPVATSTAPQTQHCREFQKTVTIGGKTEKAYGTSCLQPDGSWKTVSPAEATAPPPVAVAPVYPAYPAYPAYPPYPYGYYPGYVYGPPVAVGLGFGFGRRW